MFDLWKLGEEEGDTTETDFIIMRWVSIVDHGTYIRWYLSTRLRILNFQRKNLFPTNQIT